MSADGREASGTDASRRVFELAAALSPYHQRYEVAHDARAVFAYTYFNLTRALAERLAEPASGFDDPDWVADLAWAFGHRYMAAMDQLDQWQRSSEPTDPASLEALYADVPRPWADVYRAICLERSTVLEDLVYAMFAHISYDLPFALLEVDTAVDRLADYHLMNDVLAEHTELIQEVVTDRYDRFLTRIDRFVGTSDEFFTNYGIRVSRAVAWYNAMRMQSPGSRTAAADSLERSTRSFIESVRRPQSRTLAAKISAVRSLSSLIRRWPESQADHSEILVHRLAGP